MIKLVFIFHSCMIFISGSAVNVLMRYMRQKTKPQPQNPDFKMTRKEEIVIGVVIWDLKIEQIK